MRQFFVFVASVSVASASASTDNKATLDTLLTDDACDAVLSFCSAEERLALASTSSAGQPLKYLDLSFSASERFYDDPVFRATVLSRVSDPRTQIALNLDFMPPEPERVKDVHELRLKLEFLPFISALPDLSAYMNLAELTLDLNITDVSSLCLFEESNLRELKIQSKEFRTTALAGLECLSKHPRLELVDLTHKNFDVSRLSGLKNLKSFTARFSTIHNFNSMSHLQAVEHLNLASAVGIESIESLRGLPRLKHLDLSGTRVSDLSPLTTSLHLKTLILQNARQVSDISSLAGLVRLQELNVELTGVSDICVIANLKSLRVLNLRRTRVTDISPLRELYLSLQRLDLSFLPISSIQPLEGLVNLLELSIDRTAVADLTPLSQLTNMTELTISNIAVGPSLAPLMGMTQLRVLQIDLARGFNDDDFRALLHRNFPLLESLHVHVNPTYFRLARP